jgi:hypothetical protein
MWKRLWGSLSKRGLKRTCQSAISIPQDYVFDFLHQTETAQRVRQQELATVGEHKEGARDYVPTRGRAFQKLLERITYPRDSVFVDFGSGKGKILLLASKADFKRVVGVEFSRDLCELAMRNIASFRQRVPVQTEFEVECIDAAEFRIPDDANVFFMFNPFGRAVMERVARNIALSLKMAPRKIWLIYNDPIYAEILREQLMLSEELTFSYGGHDFVVLVNRVSEEPGEHFRFDGRRK